MIQAFVAVAVSVLVLHDVTPVLAQAAGAPVQDVAPSPPPPPSSPPAAEPASATADPIDRPFARLFPNLLTDLRRLPSLSTGLTLGLGGVASLVARPNDDHLTEHAAAGGTDQIFKVGGTLGTAYTQVGGAIAAYALGRLTKHEKLAHVGADLIRAQLLTGLLTHSLKLAVRRERPEGQSATYSFPSGHASSSFASATVLWRHFGWRAGVPATVLAAFASGGRLQENQHYMSDVAFGAALGIAGGRTVTTGHGGPKLLLTPTVVRGGGGVFVTVLDR